MKHRPGEAGVLAFLLALGGCVGVVFTDRDLGETREVFQGTTFSISLPGAPGDRTPEMKGTILRFLGREVDPAAHRDIFQFKALGPGEDILRIPPAPGDPTAGEFSIRIRVSSVSGEPQGVMHQH
jgi:hypothetical protein